jgi:hypothetical protein
MIRLSADVHLGPHSNGFLPAARAHRRSPVPATTPVARSSCARLEHAFP